MNDYFEFYNIPASFSPDAASVKKKYYELSRQYHPDRYVQATDEQQAHAIQMAAMNNVAYKTLTDTDATIAYLLKLQGLLDDEEKYQLPPAFLGEMMDLNEAVSDYETEPDNEKLKALAINTLEEQLNGWKQTMVPLIKKAEENGLNKESLAAIKDYYFRHKYLLRIKERIATFAAR